MTAPLDAIHGLAARQVALLHGELNLRATDVHPRLRACARADDLAPALCYILVEEDDAVTAMVNFRPRERIEDEPAFNIELSVPEDRRRQGRGQEAVDAALLALRHELARHGIATFHVEAIVEMDNAASARIAENSISEIRTATTDLYSGRPAFRYLRSFEPAPAGSPGALPSG
jgi:predicted acetyltransferase